MKCNIIDYLSQGEENSVTAKELAKILNWNERDVTIAINGMRNSGEVICSSINGYFLPSCLYDVQKFHRTMTSRIKEIERSKQSALEFILKNGGEL